MVRQRLRGSEGDGGGGGGPTTSAHKRPGNPGKGGKGQDGTGSFKGSLGKLAVVVVVGIVLGYQGYLETRIYTPLNAPKAVINSGLSVPERFWGSYRPGVYFGMKTRSTPGDLMTGLMWMLPELIKPGDIGLRHWCEQGDNLDRFGWVKHDGLNFGVHELTDRGVNITASFVKQLKGRSIDKGGSWSNRIRATHSKEGKKSPESATFFYYVALDEGAIGNLEPLFFGGGVAGNGGLGSRMLTGVKGKTGYLGNFKINFMVDQENMEQKPEFFFTAMPAPDPSGYTKAITSKLRLYQDKDSQASKKKNPAGGTIGLESRVDLGEGGSIKNVNFIAIQINAKLPFEFDVVYRNELDFDDPPLTGAAYSTELEMQEWRFNDRFEKVFGLKERGFDEEAVNFAQSAMSNMIGGIGYFYGQSLVNSDRMADGNTYVPYWNAPLYTGVPSRSFFPRGFLWDEGFHNLLISKWDPEISADIVAHWLDLMNSEGWIPREQILGSEARAKVPIEFVVQSNKNANPPTLLLTLHSMVRDISKKTWSGPRVEEWFEVALVHMWPRLVAWYSWFDTTQAGEAPGTFRWRGRDPTAVRELNPKTLTSGLDDYPRASHPTEDERHVDLRCWMGLASKLMADIAAIIGRPEEAEKYNNTANFLHDNWLLDDTHWSEEHHSYLDYGLHTDSVVLAKPQFDPNNPHQSREKVRKVLKEPRKQFVNQVGYISLFPLLLGILDVNSPKLGLVLDALEDPEKMYTPYGLRSLSKRASMYNKYNTEHDAPYWRGPIWLNINFLAVRALHRVRTSSELTDEKVRTRADRIYRTLRTNLINNVMGEYRRTGYIWEQYDDKTGQGKGCKPFTGWSALVVLLMSENY